MMPIYNRILDRVGFTGSVLFKAHFSMHIAGLDVVGGLSGGILIGIASSALLYLTGKVTGISGITHSIVTARNLHNLLGWRAAYVGGLMTSGALLVIFFPAAFGQPSKLRPWAGALAGLLVGLGARLGSGCTSGHGVCGLPRLSPRSLVAVGTFMATGMMTATLVRNTVLEAILHQQQPFTFNTAALSPRLAQALPYAPAAAVVLGSAFLFQYNGWLRKLLGIPEAQHTGKEQHAEVTHFSEYMVSFLNAMLFGTALGVAGMTNHESVRGFLDFSGKNGWNPTLAFVMGGAVLFNIPMFKWLRQQVKPVLADNRPFTEILPYLTAPQNMNIDYKLVLGSALFGAGWGLGGFCPGPALVSLGGGSHMAAIIVPSMLVGMISYEFIWGGGVFHHRHHHAHHHSSHEATAHGEHKKGGAHHAHDAANSHTADHVLSQSPSSSIQLAHTEATKRTSS